jgi:hypothetical protein
MEYLVNDSVSLEKLKKDKNIKNSIRIIKLKFLDSKVSELYERKLNRYYFACGCQQGAVFVYLTIFFVIVLSWLYKINIFQNWWKILILLACSAVIGKFSGILLSRYRLKQVFRKLEIYVSDNAKT